MARALGGRAEGYAANVILLNGPTKPRLPLSLIHPLGPIFRHLPLSLRRHLLYLRAHKRWGNFREPRLWNEKIQWRILNDRRALLAFTCDKRATGEYIATLAAAANPLIDAPEIYWVGRDVRELEQIASSLPPRWVLKPNHSSGRIAVLDSSATPVDWTRLIAAGREWMRQDEEIDVFGHWAYTRARPLLFAQQRIGDGEGSPPDIRLLCSRGRILLAFVTSDYQTDHYKISFYGEDLASRIRWGHPYETSNETRSAVDELSPETRAAIIALAKEASAPFDSIRIDGLFFNGRFHFLEFTSYPTSGLGKIGHQANVQGGAAWQLPDLSTPDPREAEWRALLEGTPRGTLQRT
jgi:hypothetical protein